MNETKKKRSSDRWLLCWTDEHDNTKWAKFETPDALADKLIAIIDQYNAANNAEPYGVMDFEGKWLVFAPDNTTVALEDIPCYCSDEWVIQNSYPAGGSA